MAAVRQRGLGTPKRASPRPLHTQFRHPKVDYDSTIRSVICSSADHPGLGGRGLLVVVFFAVLLRAAGVFRAVAFLAATLAVVLRAAVRFALVLRAAVRFAVVLRAAVRFAVVLRAAVRFAVVLRAAVRFAAVLRAAVRFAAVLRAAVFLATSLRGQPLDMAVPLVRRQYALLILGLSTESLDRRKDQQALNKCPEDGLSG